MSMKETLDYSLGNAEQADLGNQLPPNVWYRARVDSVVWDHKSPGTLLFTFVVTAGAYTNVQVQERLWNPDNSEDTKSAEHNRSRRKMFAVRLGLVARNECRPVDVDWEPAIGKEVAIKMVERKDKDGNMRSNVDWAGLFLLTDDRAPASVRGATPQAPGDSSPASIPLRSPPEEVNYGPL